MAATTFDADLAGKVISASALEAFTDTLAPLNAFSTSFDTEAGQVGEKIVIPFISKFAASGSTQVGTFTDGTTTYDTTGTTGADEATIDLDQHLYTSWELQDLQATKFSVGQLERFGKQKGADLAKAVFEDVLEVVTAANYSDAVTVASGSFGLDDIADLREKLVENGGDPSQSSLILNPAYFSALASQSSFQANTYGGTEVIKGGSFGSILGIPNVYESTAIPSNSENLVGILAHPAAIGVAFRYLQPLNTGAYSRAERLSNEDGMTMGYRQFYLPEKGIEYAALEALYGKVKINDQAIIRLTSS